MAGSATPSHAPLQMTCNRKEACKMLQNFCFKNRTLSGAGRYERAFPDWKIFDRSLGALTS